MAISFSIALSSIASADNLFSLVFSSSSAFSRFASETSRPPYLALSLGNWVPITIPRPLALFALTKSRGNDLSTPIPEIGFRGLKPGDRWCLCAPRWQEAFEAGQAPRVVLRATHEAALDQCSLADLKRFAVDLA